MRELYRGHEIDCHRGKCMGGWSQLFYSIFRISDGYELTSGFSTGEDKIKDFIGYMRERIDAYIHDPGEEVLDATEEEIEYHRQEIAKSMEMKTFCTNQS